ncbi:FkbM family methyltransferase [archaeon]|nr:MAG: FkbM family methyltransferase [archaeon]
MISTLSYFLCFLCLCFLPVAWANNHQHGESLFKHPLDEAKKQIYRTIANFSQNCPGGVLLDFGSNTGVQLYRFCEPTFLPKSPMKKRFNEVFGLNRTGACIISFEPNPNHIQSIHTVAEYCRARNVPVLQLSKVALWQTDTNMTFYVAVDDVMQIGSSVFLRSKYKNPKMNAVEVQALSVPMVFRVVRNNLPRPISIFVKMDIEGAEFEVLRALLHTNTLCLPSDYEIEYHHKKIRNHDFPHKIAEFMKFVGAGCNPNVTINALDDETGALFNVGDYLSGRS